LLGRLFWGGSLGLSLYRKIGYGDGATVAHESRIVRSRAFLPTLPY
jgi:hypothetical protein